MATPIEMPNTPIMVKKMLIPSVIETFRALSAMMLKALKALGQ